MEETQQNKKLIRLKEKYGDRKLRKAMIFDDAGIPEKFWFNEGNDDTEAIVTMVRESDYELITVATKFDKTQLKILSSVAVKCINDSMEVKMTDFYRIVSLMKTEFGQLNIEKLLRAFDGVEVIIISGIKPGDVLVKNDELFRNFIHNLMYDSMSRKIIFGIDYYKESQSEGWSDYYNSLFEYIENSQNEGTFYKVLDEK